MHKINMNESFKDEYFLSFPLHNLVSSGKMQREEMK